MALNAGTGRKAAATASAKCPSRAQGALAARPDDDSADVMLAGEQASLPSLSSYTECLFRVARRCNGNAASLEAGNKTYVTDDFGGITLALSGSSRHYEKRFHQDYLRSHIEHVYAALPQSLRALFTVEGYATCSSKLSL